MLESTTIIAFDQHAATTVAAVLLPTDRTPALHSMTSGDRIKTDRRDAGQLAVVAP